MPANVVKTPEQERLWNKAKAQAEKQGRGGDYQYIMGIFKKMGGMEKSMEPLQKTGGFDPKLVEKQRTMRIAQELHDKNKGTEQSDLHYRATLRAIVAGNWDHARSLEDKYEGAKQAMGDFGEAWYQGHTTGIGKPSKGVQTGPQGGQFVMEGGKKRYITKQAAGASASRGHGIHMTKGLEAIDDFLEKGKQIGGKYKSRKWNAAKRRWDYDYDQPKKSKPIKATFITKTGQTVTESFESEADVSLRAKALGWTVAKIEGGEKKTSGALEGMGTPVPEKRSEAQPAGGVELLTPSNTKVGQKIGNWVIKNKTKTSITITMPGSARLGSKFAGKELTFRWDGQGFKRQGQHLYSDGRAKEPKSTAAAGSAQAIAEHFVKDYLKKLTHPGAYGSVSMAARSDADQAQEEYEKDPQGDYALQYREQAIAAREISDTVGDRKGKLSEKAKKEMIQRITTKIEAARKEMAGSKSEKWSKKVSSMEKSFSGVEAMHQYLLKADKPSFKDWIMKIAKKESMSKAEGGGPFIGPRGGKWADAQHTIPWDEKRHAAGKKQQKPRGEADEPMAQELELTIVNEGQLHNQMMSIRKNLANKLADGKYDHAQASKAWAHAVDQGAKLYQKEFGVKIDKATRMAVARALSDQFHEEAKEGEWDDLLNKKNKKAVGSLAQGKDDSGGGTSKVYDDTAQWARGADMANIKANISIFERNKKEGKFGKPEEYQDRINALQAELKRREAGGEQEKGPEPEKKKPLTKEQQAARHKASMDLSMKTMGTQKAYKEAQKSSNLLKPDVYFDAAEKGRAALKAIKEAPDEAFTEGTAQERSSMVRYHEMRVKEYDTLGSGMAASREAMKWDNPYAQESAIKMLQKYIDLPHGNPDHKKRIRARIEKHRARLEKLGSTKKSFSGVEDLGEFLQKGSEEMDDDKKKEMDYEDDNGEKMEKMKCTKSESCMCKACKMKKASCKKSFAGLDAMGDFLEKAQSLPTGNPKQKIDSDSVEVSKPCDGGKVAGKGETSGPNTQPKSHQKQIGGKEKVKREILSTDDQIAAKYVEEGYMGEGMRKGEQREITRQELEASVAHERAVVESRLRKGEEDIEIAPHPYSMNQFHGGTDGDVERLDKSEFYVGVSPTAAPAQSVLSQSILCKSCSHQHSAMLTSCPNCGDNVAVPGVDNGQRGSVILEKSIQTPHMNPNVDDDLIID